MSHARGGKRLPPPGDHQGDAAPHDVARRWLGVSPRALVVVVLFAAYTVLTVLILVKSPVLTFDQWLLRRHLWYHHPGYHPWIKGYVILGQRGPATLFFLPFFFWVAWRQRSTRPLVMLVTALILLNLSVGIVKIITGRIGPLFQNDEHVIFAGGNIYPSGHVSNVVVLYALITWIAPKYRRTLIVVTVWLSMSIGLCTVYLRTHWFSDVLAGWMAGALVLLALPTCMPFAQRVTDRAIEWVRPRFMRHERPRRVAQWLYDWAERHFPGKRPVPVPFRPSTARASTARPNGTTARSKSFPATVVSLDGLDESARRDGSHNSPTPYA